MKFFQSESNDPSFNLALEQYLLTDVALAEPIFYTYINEPAVIIGRHQNTYAEIKTEYIKEDKLPIIRRMSGGGAVYHDLGNLNYSFILPNDKEMLDFKKVIQPLLLALRNLGIVDVDISGRNDLEIAGKKISGMAMYKKNNHILLHGTLLYDADLTKLADILNVKKDKIESKGIKSVKARVTNIKQYLPADKKINNTEEFRDLLIAQLREILHFEPLTLTSEDYKKVDQIKAKYYDNWDWNFGKEPYWNFQQAKRFPFGEIEVKLNVANGRISDFKLYGDYFAVEDIDGFETKLIGLKYDNVCLQKQLKVTPISDYIPQLTNMELLNLLFIED